MPELGSLGTVRGALGNGRPYREHSRSAALDPSAVVPLCSQKVGPCPRRPLCSPVTSGADAPTAAIPLPGHGRSLVECRPAGNSQS